MAEKINKYKTLELLGKGAFGRVYRGLEVPTKRPVAIKVISLKNISVGMLKQNINEIMMLSSIKSRYVCGFVDAFIEYTQSELWIILEYCDEENIGSIIDKHEQEKTKIPEKTIWKYLIQTAIGLRTIHRYHIVHRDIKPSNLLLVGPDLTVKISDFNVSEMLDSTSNNTIVGTPSYIAPEVWRNTNYTFACDVFALGCIIYEMVALRTAFYRDDVNALRDLILLKHPEKITDGYSTELKNVIYSCLTKDPERRITLSRLLQLPVVSERAKELGISLHDTDPGFYVLNRVTLELGKTYPNGKDGKDFHSTLVNSICNWDFKDVVNEKEGLSPSRQATKPSKRGSRELDPINPVKGSDKLVLPLKKQEKSEVLDKSINGGTHHLPLKWVPSKKEASPGQVPFPKHCGSMRELEKCVEAVDVREKLDDRETLSEIKLKLLLKMQIKITETQIGERKPNGTQKKSLSAVPNEKFRQKVNEFSKKLKSRKVSPHGSTTPVSGKRYYNQDTPDAIHTTPQQVRLKTVRSDIKLTPKPSLMGSGEGGQWEKSGIKNELPKKR